MGDIREKLKKLLFDVPCESECEGELGSCPDRKYGKCKRMDRLEYCTVQKIADHLIANGVTFQKWIPVTERLPEKEEYTAKSKDGTEYYTRLLIAYKTDIVEYEIGYYDGYKWLSEMPAHVIKDVIAWRQFEPLPEPPKEDG